ncbi:hypothetical protein [Krasilnikovia sp. MM14-A1259]|uniref:hypothetical protein n=1 Tax=Krasilnikovia sp. MM14-A1259 TaxID=3373539 RepID=UPI003813BA20
MLDPEPGVPAASPPAAVLASLTGPRSRTLDEHMYQLPRGTGRRATFRLQLFTAAGLRPVAVATQIPGAGEGSSLTNVAEKCAATVWQQHFPDDLTPPIWIAHMIMDGHRDLTWVTFTEDPGAHTLHDPQWVHLDPADVDALVGEPVDLERGAGFVAPEPDPEPEQVYAIVPVVLLPRPHPFRKDACMPAGVRWWRRLSRQVVPLRSARDCCWYHGGDWHVVARLAERLFTQAHAAGLTFDDTMSYMLNHPGAHALPRWEREALHSLVLDTIRPYGPWPSRKGYNNGQHRAQALIEAGVRRILVERMSWCGLDPIRRTTGSMC